MPSALKRRKVADVTAQDVRRIHKKLGDAGKAPTADHVKTVLHAVFELAITEGLIDSNPAAAIKRYAKPPEPRRALTLDRTLNAYIHVDMAALQETADKVSGRIALRRWPGS